MLKNLASLAMYDLAEVRPWTNAWWAGLRRHWQAQGIDHLPATLPQPGDLIDHWSQSGLIVSQTCGYPLTHLLPQRLALLGTPCYAAPGCSGPYYRSVIVVRNHHPATTLAALRGTVVAVNGSDSQSGYNILRYSVASLAEGGHFFSRVVESGGHRHSIAAVAQGEADVCAVDCVTYALLARHAPRCLDKVRVLTTTAAAPGLPLVSDRPELIAALRRGFWAACADPDLAPARRQLLIRGLRVLPRSRYHVITAMAAAARQAGYATLA